MLKRKTGFTLIELLVVIAIIALLLAIILPSIAMVKERSRRVVCLSNIRQFITAAHLYGNNNNGFLPSGLSDKVGGFSLAENQYQEHTPNNRNKYLYANA